MRRLAPPLLVLLVLAVIGVRFALEPSRAEARERIRGLVQGGLVPEATAEVDAYLARYDTEDDVWFATWAWFRLGRADRALALVFDHPSIPGQPGTARRFARTGLYALGWEDGPREEPTAREPLALVALAEGEDDWAQGRLRQHALTLDLMGSTLYFFPAHQRATPGPLARIVAAYREREDERFQVAAAIGALGGAEGTHTAEDERRLREVIADERWRRSLREVWCAACVALGRSGSPGAVEALEAAARRLDGSVNEIDREDRQLAQVGLVAAGRFDGVEEIAPMVFSDAAVRIVTVWFLEALIHRYLAGDAQSESWLRRMWEGPGARFGGLRDRMARAFLLQHALPGEAALEAWVGRMLSDLESPDAPISSRALARSYRLRAGAPGAREALLDLLRDIAGRPGQPGSLGSERGEGFLEGLRALYLYE